MLDKLSSVVSIDSNNMIISMFIKLWNSLPQCDAMYKTNQILIGCGNKFYEYPIVWYEV